MKYIPSSPPLIPALTWAADRPLWSVMIPVYNNAQYLPETLESVLKQNIPEEKMQIEVVDDASTDINIEALVNHIGKGRIKYFRQKENVGSLRNFETCLNRSKGKLIHLLHGDDRVLRGYYNKMESLFEQFPEAGAAFCRFNSIDENGKKISSGILEMQKEGLLQDWLCTIGERQRIQYAAITVRREVFEKLGAFFGITYGEDWEMWVRIARHYAFAYTPAILAEYRKHANSITGNKFLTAEHLKDISSAMLLIQQHLPSGSKKIILERSRKYYASYGIKIANQLWHKLHSRQIINLQIKQILNLYRSPLLYYKIARLYIKIVFNRS